MSGARAKAAAVHVGAAAGVPTQPLRILAQRGCRPEEQP